VEPADLLALAAALLVPRLVVLRLVVRLAVKLRFLLASWVDLRA